jgi:hypothetical protein
MYDIGLVEKLNGRNTLVKYELSLNFAQFAKL